MAFVQAEQNEQNFSEKTEGAGGDTQVLVNNVEGRAIDPFEILMAASFPFYIGEVRDADGIAIAGTGLVNIEHRRVIRTEQMEVTDTFVAGEKVYFSPGGAGVAGLIIDLASKGAGDIEYGTCEGFGGSAGAHTYIEVRPYAYDEGRILEV